MASRLHSIEYREIQAQMHGQLRPGRAWATDPSLDHNGQRKWYHVHGLGVTNDDLVEFAAREYMKEPTAENLAEWIEAIEDSQ